MKHWGTDIFEYGEKQGLLFHSTEVKNGLKCECTCPACGKKLIAVNRIKHFKPRPHFRHYSNASCDHKTYRETVIHLLSKQIIESKGYINIPDITLYLTDDYNSYMTEIDPDEPSAYLPIFIDQDISVYKLEFDSIEVEKKKGQIKPDLQVFKNGISLIIEVAYSHFVDDEKLGKIESDHLNAVEIDLSRLNKIATGDEIEDAIYNIQNTYWLNNEKNSARLKVKLNQAVEVREYCWSEAKHLKTYANMKRIYNCPQKKYLNDQKYVLIESQCKKCKFFLDIMEDINYKQEEYNQEIAFLVEIGEDPSILIDTYDEKVFFKSGTVVCCGNIENRLITRINTANTTKVKRT